ncbi:energy-coupling factor transporter ATPase [Candidatus Poribacteria bacterium]|nr:energy-coupling factor transporter ATPase [Candidatus Poribacteria bacterium]
MIKIIDLTFYYNKDTPLEKLALDNISFEIDRGDCLGIIGHSGSGKSTLAQHLNGLLTPHHGKIFIDDEDITNKKTDLVKLRKKVGLVFQFPEDQLFEETVFSDVAYAIKNQNLSNDQIIEKMKSIFKLVNLNFEKIANRSPFDLSGGEKRKVALAGIFIMHPEILVLDEPTAGLDPKSIKETIAYIKSLKNLENKTILIVSHNIEIVSQLCNKALALKDGKIKFFGITKNLLKEIELLKELNLRLPPVTRIMHTLKKNGFNVNDDISTVPEAVAEIKKIATHLY